MREMSKKSQLEILVDSLTTDEKKAVKKAISGKIIDGKYLIWIFDELCRGGSPKHDTIVDAFAAKFPDGKASRYYYHATILKQTTLKALVLATPSPSLRDVTNINIIQILVRKTMYAEAEAIIKKTLISAQKHENFTAISMLVEEQKEIWARLEMLRMGKQRIGKKRKTEIAALAKIEVEARKNALMLNELDSLLFKIAESPREELERIWLLDILQKEPPKARR
ncbi:MAG TPA: hypothetical protein ENJ82_16670, partial [Bacteroidetes bacterium]|nr:hypothetical protein [Bacteroidota bacterium]